MKISRLMVTVVCLALLPVLLFAQESIHGKVTDAETGDGLAGANIVVTGTSRGAATDVNGEFTIRSLPPGTYTLRASYIGYDIMTKEVSVMAGEVTTVAFALQPEALLSEAILISASRAKERETPVAFTDVKKEAIEANLGSRDIPLVLNTTPSVYATQQGGGAGDARVNVRGFNQRNVAIMINGVPVNDMENGWVYWSNWDGVGDATSSIQVQRGLSAVNLAVPSIGGTMNVLTDPTALERGGKFRQELGNDGFLKSTLVFNSGLVNEKFAFSGALVRKIGDGLIDGTWTDAWAYYFGASYNVNANNRLELYALGAPQRHGQNLYRQNIAVYDSKFALELDDYDPKAFEKYTEVGRRYNENWNRVSTSYTGQQAVGDKTFDRHEDGFLNERENFYHKPQVNLNWFSRLTDKLGLYSILYYSGGTGGGTGTYGSLVWDYSGPSRVADWDATIERNRNNDDGSRGVLRNSRNNQWTIGAISKAAYDVNDALKLTFGLDWRTAEIEHYREIRDLLGGSYYRDKSSDFWSEAEQKRGLGDKINYFFTNTVDWFGFFGQGEYTSGKISLYGMAGPSWIKYKHNNHFRKDPTTGGELQVESPRISGGQIKGGASYRVSGDLQLFANAGYVSKVPIFDNVISDRTGTRADNPKNEKFTSVEAGLNWRGLDGQVSFRGNVYYTKWEDRAKSLGIRNEDGSEGLVFLTGMNTLHQGIELEAAYQPTRYVRLDGAASFGDWTYTDDVSGVYVDYEADARTEVPYNFYVKDLKVGDAPQTQIALQATIFPTEGMSAKLVYRNYSRYWADWDPFSRTNPNDRAQSWRVPAANVFDFHATYKLPISFGRIRPLMFLHVFNVFDEVYVQDAVDNSRFNAYKADVDGDGKKEIVNPHKADAAEVFLGLPRFWNLGIQLNY